MANEVTKFTPTSLGVRPAHLTASYGETDTNLIVGGMRVPSLTFQNRIFKIDADGEEHRLTKEVDGETVPIPAIPVIILGLNDRSRVYYKGTFDAGNVKAPDCWSSDSVKPDDAVPEKVNPVCATCPMSAKGSKVSDNNKNVAACQQRRVVAVVPAKGLTKFPPLRLSLPITSDYDGRSPHNDKVGKFAFSNYIDFIRNNGAKMTYDLVTRMSFDTTEGVTYPKLLFSALDWVGDGDAKIVREMLDSGAVERVLGQSEGAQQAAVAEKMNADAQAKPDDGGKTRKARGNGKDTSKDTATKVDPKVAESAKQAAEAQKRKEDAQKKAAAARAAAEEAARLAAEAEAEAGDGAGDLGGDLGDETHEAQNNAEDRGEVDPRNPPEGASLAADEEVNDIINQWGED